MLTTAVKEVKIKRELKKEVAIAGDVQLLSYHLQVHALYHSYHECANLHRGTHIYSRKCEVGRSILITELIMNCTNPSEVEINSQSICLIRNNN